MVRVLAVAVVVVGLLLTKNSKHDMMTIVLILY